MKVYITIENDSVGEIEGTIIEGNLREMKQVASKWNKRAIKYSSNKNENHYVKVEFYESSDSDWSELYNFTENL